MQPGEILYDDYRNRFTNFGKEHFDMNIEIANRLVNLRKQNGLSQEQLAEKIGVSRQAVSKWERSEASPDTDNLILLARLYNVSLDELLNTEDEIPVRENEENTDNASGFDTEPEWDNSKGINVHDGGDHVHVGFDGINVVDKNGSRVHVGFDGIHVDENGGENVSVDKDGVYINGERKDIKKTVGKHVAIAGPAFLTCLILFLGLGFSMNGWGWCWLSFLLIPVITGIVEAIYFRDAKRIHTAIVFGSLVTFLGYGLLTPDGTAWGWCWLFLLLIPILCSFIDAIRKRRASEFAFPVLVAGIYLVGGIFYGMWHPFWVIFLSVPLFYWVCSLFRLGKEEKNESCTENPCCNDDNNE